MYVKNSTITGITDGLYIAVNAISANTPFTAADLDNTDTAEGGLNASNSKINNSNTSAETIVGTYNGKTLYRRFYSFANKSGDNNNIGTLPVPMSVEYKNVNEAYTYIDSSTNNILPPYRGSDGFFAYIRSDGAILVTVTGYTGSGSVCVEYTKT